MSKQHIGPEVTAGDQVSRAQLDAWRVSVCAHQLPHVDGRIVHQALPDLLGLQAERRRDAAAEEVRALPASLQADSAAQEAAMCARRGSGRPPWGVRRAPAQHRQGARPASAQGGALISLGALKYRPASSPGRRITDAVWLRLGQCALLPPSPPNQLQVSPPHLERPPP